MSGVRPMLGDLELVQVQRIVVDDHEVLAAHGVAALDGDLLQRLARRAGRIRLSGVLTGTAAGTGLANLRAAFRAARPVPFTADIATATSVGEVLIEELAVRELAGRPARYEYALGLRQYTPAAPPRSTGQPATAQGGTAQGGTAQGGTAQGGTAGPPSPPPEPGTGTLVIDVGVTGQPDFDPATVRLSAQESTAGTARTLTTRAAARWTEAGLPPGAYTVTATAPDPFGAAPLRASAAVTVRGGQTAQVSLALNSGPPVAEAYLVSFDYASAFVAPGMRPVLREVAARAAAGTGEHLLIVGHTDRTGPDAYNQALSERRGRAVHAYLTAGRDLEAAVAAWTDLRQPPGAGAAADPAHDGWGRREYQHMLQDLGFYPGHVDGADGPLTQEAVRAFRCSAGLPPGLMDDAAWDRLIRAYLRQIPLAVPAERFVRDTAGQPLPWVGCGERTPLPLPRPTRGTAFRPYRRVEALFVRADRVPCDAVERHCFGTRDCARAAPGQWCVQPADPATLTVTGSIRRERRAPDGTVTLVPAADQRFVLITPGGEYRRGEQADGEPLPARTRADGSFSLPDLPVGHYHLAVGGRPAPLARLAEDPPEAATGPAVTKRLGVAGDRLDIVLVAAPTVRRIRLPVVAHLITMLHPVTRTVRTCPDPLSPTRLLPQRTARTAAEIRALIAAVNEVWAPARIAFELVDVVEEVVAHPGRDACTVTGQELDEILTGGNRPDVVNVFFFGLMETIGEAGVCEVLEVRDPATGMVVELVAGIGVSDQPLVDRFTGSPPLPVTLDEAERTCVLAHEFGHYLSLPDVDDSAGGRLMLYFAGAGHRTITDAEVTAARAAAGPGECRPLTLRVTGAVPVGVHSGLFAAPVGQAGPVTIDAEIPAELLAAGTLEWTDGVPGAGPTQRRVTTNAGLTKVIAAYRPAGGGDPATTFVRILVTGCVLRVDGAQPAGGPGGTSYVVRRDAAGTVTVRAELSIQPECLSRDLVAWSGGDRHDDPLRRTVRLDRVASTVVTATVGGVASSVTIVVVDAVLRDESPGRAGNRILIEGLANADLSRIRRSALVATQPAALVRAVVEIPGVVGDTVEAALISTAADGTAIETLELRRDPDPVRDRALRRVAGTDTFRSLPLLAVPDALPRADMTLADPPDLLVIRAHSGGTLTLRPAAPYAAVTAWRTVQARRVRLAVQVFTGSGVSAERAHRQVGNAARAWAQAGVEVVEASLAAGVKPPADLLDLDHTDDYGKKLTDEEQRLVGRKAGGPTRSPVPDLNVYYLRSIGVVTPEKRINGIAYPADNVIAVVGAASDWALAHELGHQIITGWPKQEHQTTGGDEWPKTNVLCADDTGRGRDVDPTQIDNVVRHTAGHSYLAVKP